MNLPPDKARLLRQYDNEKKWELICDQVRNIDAFFQEIMREENRISSLNISDFFSGDAWISVLWFAFLLIMTKGKVRKWHFILALF